MKTLPPGLQDHLASGATTLCWCWKIARGDGARAGLHRSRRAGRLRRRDLRSGERVSRRARCSRRWGSPSTTSPSRARLSSASLNEHDLAAGLYDDADIEIWRVNWATPDQRVLMRKGNLGQVSRGRCAFQAEVRGLAHKLNQSVGRAYGYSCDADLGDARCTVASRRSDVHRRRHGRERHRRAALHGLGPRWLMPIAGSAAASSSSPPARTPRGRWR